MYFIYSFYLPAINFGALSTDNDGERKDKEIQSKLQKSLMLENDKCCACPKSEVIF